MLCIPKPVAEKLKEAVRKGEISIAKLYESTSAERAELFGQYTTKELAQEINAGFEKAMVSKQKDAFKSWAESVFTEAQKQTPAYKAVLEKIKDLEKTGAVGSNSDSFLADLVADRLGVSVTPEEVQQIQTKAEKLQEFYKTPDEFGLPTQDYWKARKDMDDYIDSLNPAPITRVLTSTIGRAAMLFSVKSPTVNIIANTMQGVFEGFARRIAEGSYVGMNGDFALKYAKRVMDIYSKSGFDVSRMETIDQGQRRLGEDIVHSQGKGVIRKYARINEDIVFKNLMGAPDVAASAIAFADTANIASSKIAQKEGLTGDAAKKRALEIFKDAVRIDPLTIEGEIVRSNAIANATYSTGTHKSAYSDVAMALRTAINKATGNIRLGDQLMPFIKVPANFVQIGVDAAGMGAFKGFFKLADAMRSFKTGDTEPMKEVIRLFARAGLGLSLAVMLAYMLKPDDFVGDYDSLTPQERDLATIKNAPYNSVKVGKNYISLDYLGPLASAFVGVMYARKYGHDIPSALYQYGRGAGSQALRVPGLHEFADLVSNISDAVKQKDIKKVGEGLADDVVAYIRARSIPAIVNDLAQATDKFQRKTGSDQLSKAKASIPGLRETVPIKVDRTSGESMENENFFSTLFFGSRVKTGTDNALVKEITRLSYEGQTPTVSDIERSSQRIIELKEQISPANYDKAIRYFGQQYGKEALHDMKTGAFKKADDEGKKKIINSARDAALDNTLTKFHYKKPKKK